MFTSPEKNPIFIKSIHTAIWVLFVGVICFVLWSGITSNITVYSWLAAAAILAEGIVLAIFKGNCPLTVVARKYSNSTKENFDIYLPNWLAKYNKLIFTTIYAFGLLLMLFNFFKSDT
ncbi:MAG TPA: hypothetical protein VFU05_01775 [Cyclobacteriaceae bacterium]|nr:hypothetical protein [Cyclobacteriaceae bacterium]